LGIVDSFDFVLHGDCQFLIDLILIES